MDDLKTPQNENKFEKQPVETLRAGEKGFTFILLAAAVFCLYQSILLWIKKPGIDGPAIIPLVSSGAVVLLTVFVVIQNIRKQTEITKGV